MMVYEGSQTQITFYMDSWKKANEQRNKQVNQLVNQFIVNIYPAFYCQFQSRFRRISTKENDWKTIRKVLPLFISCRLEIETTEHDQLSSPFRDDKLRGNILRLRIHRSDVEGIQIHIFLRFLKYNKPQTEYDSQSKLFTKVSYYPIRLSDIVSIIFHQFKYQKARNNQYSLDL